MLFIKKMPGKGKDGSLHEFHFSFLEWYNYTTEECFGIAVLFLILCLFVCISSFYA